MLSDTIVAIATPSGRGGVGIVRVSGQDLAAIVNGVVGKTLTPRLATFARFGDAQGRLLDQGLALYFPAPASYTGENVLELQGHGSPVALRLLLSRCIELGARLAQPGEFTQRAFVNGKLDLAQAESVADLIEAATSTAVRAAARSLSGVFSQEVHALVGEVTTLRMFTEATLDFPDEDIDFVRAADAATKVAAVESRLVSLLARTRSGARLAEGLTVVLVGRPNVGKSSLMNRLVREDAAIVTAVAGTTRDTIERQIEISGMPVRIVDTAGLRESADAVERIGIDRTWAAVERADLIVVIADARDDGLDAQDAAILERLSAEVPCVRVYNKIDLAAASPRAERRGDSVHVWLSALTGDGVALLEREVSQLAGVDAAGEDTFIARERHVLALQDAQRHVAAAVAQLESASPALELFAEELRGAQLALSRITGEFTADDLLGVIFSRFCIGK